MIFAAGLGTRLAPLTDRMPKALVPVGGVPMLERVARGLVAAGADRLVINTHRFPEQIEAFVASRDGFGVEVVFSPEPEQPLETGGGLGKASSLFRRDAPAFLHNCDVLTALPLSRLYDAHMERRPLATLAVHERPASRYLYFDAHGLCGRVDARTGEERWARRPEGAVRRLAFAGVHVIEPALLETPPLARDGVYSIIEVYLELAGAGREIVPFAADEWAWVDIGSPARLAEAEELVARLGSEPAGATGRPPSPEAG